LVDLHRN